MGLNWNQFKAKFDGKEQSEFELLSYILFCYEHGNKIGLFRFKNQTGIETEPINIDGQYIGFQAKFYGDTKLSENKSGLMDSIKKAKNKNPELNKILFYTNREFSESSDKEEKEPQYKKDIEYFATNVNVEIEWRVPSHFEIQLMRPENKHIYEYFFTGSNNNFDFLNSLEEHTNNILFSVHYQIVYNQKNIKIKREELSQLEKSIDDNQINIVSGQGGCGKTAVIKEFYEKIKGTIPFYLFKGAEFNIFNINELFGQYKGSTLRDFVELHKSDEKKIVVIDSAERLVDIDEITPFREFLAALLRNNWKVIFTVRYGYLDDLRFQLIEILQQPNFNTININGLKESELESISKEYGFNIPSNKRLADLICIPFYLNEYLGIYKEIKQQTGFNEFKELVWKKRIQKTSERKNNIHIEREECFLFIVKTKLNNNTFFFKGSTQYSNAFSKLESDDIITYDSKTDSYFISHDIYEEWALEKIIQSTYLENETNPIQFFKLLGTSLNIRRAFRSWLSNQIVENIEENIEIFIKEAFTSINTQSFWKDELLISILLSDYSDVFFEQFESLILENDFFYLKRAIFWLRIACKDVDESSKELLKEYEFNLNYLFTRPKGNGWNTIISLLYKHKVLFKENELIYIIPLLKDWIIYNKKGKTTKESALFAFHFYNEIETEERYYKKDLKENYISIILQGCHEIKDKLCILLEQVIKNKWITDDDPYYDLCMNILYPMPLSNAEVAEAIPSHIMLLANLFWMESSKSRINNRMVGTDIEVYYQIKDNNGMASYFPPSAYQTPFYNLLYFSFVNSIQFIVNFTNRAVQNYVDSKVNNAIKEINVWLSEEKQVKQYISNEIWCMYRGTGGIATPYLLQSLHMALEKRLLEHAKIADGEHLKYLETWLIYLLENSKSASISAVVTSVVLAYPNKLFNIANILLRTREFISYDYRRAYVYENETPSLYGIANMGDYKSNICAKERLSTIKENHRKSTLETIALNFQYFRTEDISEEQANERQKTIEDILDIYYDNIKMIIYDDDTTIKLRYSLSRMDRRKMKPKHEKIDGGVLIDFNPQLDEDLIIARDNANKEFQNKQNYNNLWVWGMKKMRKEEIPELFAEFNNPLYILNETKKVIQLLSESQELDESLFLDSVPAFTCSILLQEHLDILNEEEKNLCKEVVMAFSRKALNNYLFQSGDGVEICINTLPFMFEIFPEEKEEYKLVLLLILMNDNAKINQLAINSIVNNLWDKSAEDAQNILSSYLMYKPKLDEVFLDIQRGNRGNYQINIHKQYFLEFLDRYNAELKESLLKNTRIDFNFDTYNFDIAEIILQIIPSNTKDKNHYTLIENIVKSFAHRLLDDDKEDLRYKNKNIFYRKLAHFLLQLDNVNDIDKYVQPFINGYKPTGSFESLLHELVSAEDVLNSYNNFWHIWNLVYKSIIEECRAHPQYYYNEKIIRTYMLAWQFWKDTAKDWRSLKDENKIFFERIVNEVGYCPSVLYSISKLLNQIGSNFINDGVLWIGKCIEQKPQFKDDKIESNTILYIELFIRRFIEINRIEIKRDINTKNTVLDILDYLISKASTTGYLLRENII